MAARRLQKTPSKEAETAATNPSTLNVQLKFGKQILCMVASHDSIEVWYL